MTPRFNRAVSPVAKPRGAGGLSRIAMIAGAFTLVACSNFKARVFDDLPKPKLPPIDPLATLGTLSAKQCKNCHRGIYAEWTESLHGQSVTDRLYRADLNLQGSPYFCDYCHAPLVEQRPTTVSGLESVWPVIKSKHVDNPRYQAELHAEGINCVACHQRDGAMIGPIQTSSAPHPTRQSAELRDPAFCAPCHQLNFEYVGNLQRPIADTLNEWAEYRQKGGKKVCVDCHMPTTEARSAAVGAVARPGTDHRLRGASSLEFVREGLKIAVDWQKRSTDRVRAKIRLENRSGHRMPTAEPHRRIDVFLALIDANGKTLEQMPYSIARRLDVHKLVEGSGQDNTLLPLEIREFVLDLSPPLPAAARSARVRVEFILWDPEDAVAQASGLSSDLLSHQLFSETIDLGDSIQQMGSRD